MHKCKNPKPWRLRSRVVWDEREADLDVTLTDDELRQVRVVGLTALSDWLVFTFNILGFKIFSY